MRTARNKYIFGAVIVFVITYALVLKNCMLPKSDYTIHGNTAMVIYEDGLAGIMAFLQRDLYPLWHLAVALYMWLTRCPINHAVAFVTSATNVMTYTLVVFYNNKGKERISYNYLIALMLMLVGPMYIPWFNESVYLGQGSPNIWHNPTHLCARPIAIATFLMTVDLLEKGQSGIQILKKKWIIYSLVIILGQLAKPSIIQIFIPAIGLFLGLSILCDIKNKVLWNLLGKMVLVYIPGVLFLIVQFYISFFGNSSAAGGFKISPFAFLGHYTSSVIFSFILANLFPIFVLFTNIKMVKKIEVKFALSLFASGFLEAALLVENGSRAMSGNFAWGYYLSIFIIYMVCLKQFIIFEKKERTRKVMIYDIGWSLFAIQLCVGCYYVWTILTNFASQL